MIETIKNEIKKIEDKGLLNTKLLALVTESSYEVIFYSCYEEKMQQSNNLAEAGIIPLEFVDSVYAAVANAIREDERFDSQKMNIVKATSDSVEIEYDEKNCRVYTIKKKWKSDLEIK